MTAWCSGLPKRNPKDASRPSDRGGIDYARLLKLTQRNARRTFYTSLHEATGYDFVRHCARRDWRKIFKRREIGADDVIFFPSAEYFGCLSLLDVVRQVPEARLQALVEEAAEREVVTLSDALQ